MCPQLPLPQWCLSSLWPSLGVRILQHSFLFLLYLFYWSVCNLSVSQQAFVIVQALEVHRKAELAPALQEIAF